jgi:hypothetical protein
LWGTFPVLCSHRHAWPLYALTKLAGIGFDSAGLILTPAPLPWALLCGRGASSSSSSGGSVDVGGEVLWSLQTPAVSIYSYPNGSWSGHYRFHSSGMTSLGFAAELPLQHTSCNSSALLRHSLDRPMELVVRLVTDRHPIKAAVVSFSVTIRAPGPTELEAWESSALVHAVASVNISVALPLHLSLNSAQEQPEAEPLLHLQWDLRQSPPRE